MGYIGSGISRFNTADELTVTGDAVIDTTTLVVDSTNNRVGVLTASPATALDVTGTVTADGLTVDADVSTFNGATVNIDLMESDTTNANTRFRQSASGLSIQTVNDAASSATNRMRIDHTTGDISFRADDGTTDALFFDASTQRLGLGTTSPATPIHTYSTSTAINRFEVGSTSDSGIRVMNTAGDYSIYTAGGSLRFADNSASEVMRFSSGNVGIGTSPSYPLHVQTTSQVVGAFISTSNDPQIYVGDAVSADNAFIMGYDRADNRGYLTVAGDSDSVFTIANGGSVGIGTTSGNETLNVNGAIGVSGASAAFGGGVERALMDYTGSVVRFGHVNGASGSAKPVTFLVAGGEKARLDASGNFFVGGTSENAEGSFSVRPNTTNGAALVQFNRASTTATSQPLVFYNGGSGVGFISYTNTGTTYNTGSDRRLKSNIQDAASASDKIDAIQVRQFDWNADDSHQDYGLIAQELQPIEPMAVTGDADSDEMMGVDYSKLVPMLIKEIQELRSRVAALEAN